ncbi:MAG: DUF3575 domain-containing protein [Muribaculaceae bacterium]|nr:DUF3575 domain-containing protein [Muribaculaceae bacterium]
MRFILKIISISLLTVFMGMQAFGNTPADSVKVFFRVGECQYDPSYENNRKAMADFIDNLRIAEANDRIDSIEVNGFEYPDETGMINHKLVSYRCDAIADYILKHARVKGITIRIKPGDITSSNSLEFRDAVTAVYYSRQEEPLNIVEPDSVLKADIPVKNGFHMDIRTNMLYDALLVPNLGAEFYLGKNISLYGEWMYAWWDNDRRHHFWRIYGGDLGLRWWFGRKAHSKPLTGHHLGVYGSILTFDFELGDTGYLGGKPGGTLWDRWLVNTGIEYGYSLPVGKRINIDFSIGIGYMGGNYIKYYPFDNDYYYDKEYHMHYIGPTKAEISLVWLIGRGNANRRKGGGK